MALRDDFVVRSKLPPTPVPENKSTPKSAVTPHSPLTRGHSKVKGSENPLLRLILSPYPLRRGVILIQTNCLKPHFLLPSRVELMTRCARRRRHADSPISRPSRALRENKGAARSAPKARAIRWGKLGSESCTILYGSVAYQRVKNEGRVRSRRFHPHLS